MTNISRTHVLPASLSLQIDRSVSEGVRQREREREIENLSDQKNQTNGEFHRGSKRKPSPLVYDFLR